MSSASVKSRAFAGVSGVTDKIAAGEVLGIDMWKTFYFSSCPGESPSMSGPKWLMSQVFALAITRHGTPAGRRTVIAHRCIATVVLPYIAAVLRLSLITSDCLGESCGCLSHRLRETRSRLSHCLTDSRGCLRESISALAIPRAVAWVLDLAAGILTLSAVVPLDLTVTLAQLPTPGERPQPCIGIEQVDRIEPQESHVYCARLQAVAGAVNPAQRIIELIHRGLGDGSDHVVSPLLSRLEQVKCLP